MLEWPIQSQWDILVSIPRKGKGVLFWLVLYITQYNTSHRGELELELAPRTIQTENSSLNPPVCPESENICEYLLVDVATHPRSSGARCCGPSRCRAIQPWWHCAGAWRPGLVGRGSSPWRRSGPLPSCAPRWRHLEGGSQKQRATQSTNRELEYQMSRNNV